MICDRCGKQSSGFTGSYFNTDTICFACAEVERKHPDFERARQIETEAVMRGDMNFPGIGLPPGLRRSA